MLDPEVMSPRVADFHNHWFRNGAWPTRWRGLELQKNPLDLWVYTQIICETKPDVIIELGTRTGGSATYLRDMSELVGVSSKVITIDVTKCVNDLGYNVWHIHGNDCSENVLRLVREASGSPHKVMAIADSDHSEEHVYRQLVNYGPIVSPGCYFIVEDTNHAVIHNREERTPLAAVKRFLSESDQFVADRDREQFLLTFNPMGYLKRVA